MAECILLLNLPFPRPLQRDYGCPHGVKARYYWPPIDLLMFGASARSAGRLHYIDAVAANLSWSAVLERILSLRPTLIFTIVSSISAARDREMLQAIHRRLPQTRIWASGDVIFFAKDRFEGVDVHVRDLTNGVGIRDLLAGGGAAGEIPVSPGQEFSIGVCPQELTLAYPYSMPYSLFPRVTTVLTNYGCPYQCVFCNSREFAFKRRQLDEIVEELRYIQELGVREVVFRDFTFNASDIESLCEKMARRGIRLAWSCWTRVDAVDRHILERMKEAGCFLVAYGIESGEDAILASSGKNTTLAQAGVAVATARELGIEVLASYILGFPGERPEAISASLFRLDPDYLSLNLLASRFGGSPSGRKDVSPQSVNRDSLLAGSPEMITLRNRIERRFYLRLSKLARYFRLALKSPWRMVIFSRNAAGLVRRWLAEREARCARTEGRAWP